MNKPGAVPIGLRETRARLMRQDRPIGYAHETGYALIFRGIYPANVQRAWVNVVSKSG